VRAVLVGIGAVGARVGRQLASTDGLEALTLVDRDPKRAAEVAASLGPPAAVHGWDPAALDDADVLVIATPDGHRAYAEAALERNAHVVSVADGIDEVRSLLALDAEARERDLAVVVGSGFSPGLSCLLARHAAADFDIVDEVRLAKVGTGGPACAAQHHEALGSSSTEWRDGAWVRRPGGSGRELSWFPDPVGGQDCYRAALPEPLLLVPAFPSAERVAARVAATRRDRMTSRLPMMRPPHPEGVIGAVRVEVRGRRGPVTDTRVLGAIDRPAVAAGAVAAVTAAWAADGRLLRAGAGGLAELVDEPVAFLAELARRGVRAAVFEGSAAIV
jgi:hypothetical protein